MKKEVSKTSNGTKAYVILNNEHMLAHSSVTEELLAEALPKVVYNPPFQIETIDMGHIIGENSCVQVTEKDDVRNECRPGREYPSRIVYGRSPEPTTLMTIGLCTDDDGLCTVFTAFPGPKAPKELADPNLREEERPAAEAFWATHALCKIE